MKPIFSVITVHFNQLSLLKSTVENILALEGFGEIIEYIVVDGMSTDGTINYLQHLCSEQPVRQLVERDKGIYDAMNKAISMASGRYVVFINAGDEVAEPGLLLKISEQVPAFDILYGHTLVAYEGFSRIAQAKPPETFWQGLPFVHQSVIIKRELLIQYPFNLTYKYCADYEQILKLYLAKVDFKKYNGVISRITAGGLSDKQRIRATKEVFSISQQLSGLNVLQKLYFRNKLLRDRLAVLAKKILPQKIINRLTRWKYS